MRDRAAHLVGLLLERTDPFPHLPQFGRLLLCDAGRHPSSTSAFFNRFPKYDLRDAEVFRDLIQRGFVLTSDRDDVAAELGWVGLGHGDILPAETNLHRSRVNQTGAAPIGAGMFAIGILGRLFVLRHRHTTSQT